MVIKILTLSRNTNDSRFNSMIFVLFISPDNNEIKTLHLNRNTIFAKKSFYFDMLKYYPHTYCTYYCYFITRSLVLVLDVTYDAFDLRVTMTERSMMHRASHPNIRPDRNEYTAERDTVYIFSPYSLQKT